MTEVERRLGEAQAAIEQSPRLATELLISVVDDFSPSDPAAAGQAAYLLARLAVMAAEPRRALDRIEQARGLFGRAGLPVSQARTDLGRINVLNDLGRHREAVEVGVGLTDQLQRLDPRDEEVQWMTAGAAENTGASYGWLGRHTEALARYEVAEQVYAEVGEPVDRARIGANRGVELIELGRHPEALQLLEQAVVVFAAEGDDLSAARCLAYVAKGHAQAGRYEMSVDTLARADARLGPHEQSNDHLRTSLVWAEVYAVLNLTEEALERCNALIPRFEDSAMAHDAGQAELVKAKVLARSGATVQAHDAVTSAEQRFTSAGLPAMVARCRLLKSELLDTESPDTELFDEVPAAGARAAMLAEQAYTMSSTAGHAAVAAEAALRCAELAAGQIEPPPSPDVDFLVEASDLIAGNQLHALNWRLHYVRGRGAECEGTDQLAIVHYRQALTALRELRSSIDTDALRIPFMTGRRMVQEALVTLLVRLGDIEGAADVTESERADTLIGRLGSRFRDGDPAVSAMGAASPPARLEVDATITYQTLGDEIVCFVRRTEDSLPRLVAANLTVSATAGLLRKLDAQWRRLADPRLTTHQDTLRVATERLLQELYLGLFEPTEEYLKPEDRVMVAPAGVLADVPFHALHNGLCHLVDRYEFSVTPSVAAAGHAPDPSANAGTVVVGVADELAPQIMTEAQQIADLTGGTLLADDRATIDAVRAAAEGASVIHLATHGRFRPDNPWFSAVRLADGWLRALDIERWDLRGALVVLAACRSGQQSATGGGDELLGIPRACLAAGATAVVVNLWPVDDHRSVGLMTGFHQRLRFESPMTALRSAQRAAMIDTPHPYHWAPAVFYGAPRFDGPPSHEA